MNRLVTRPSESQKLLLESYAEQIWALITSGKYRRGSLSYPQEAYDEIIESIEISINDSKPIELVFSFFPCKVRQPLKTMAKSGSEIDIGEIASLLRLYEICYGIMQIYEPGAKFNIMCDGFRYQDCFFDSDTAIHGYRTNLEKAIEFLGINDFIHLYEEPSLFTEAIQKKIDEQFLTIYRKYILNQDKKIVDV